MNGQLMELWGRWMTAAFQRQNQLDMINGWWLRSLQGMSLLNKPYSMPCAMASTTNTTNKMFDGLQQIWEPIFKMQQLSRQWMAMVPKEKYEALSDRAAELENKVEEQARTIERLQKLLNQTGGENNVVVTQLQDLIGQQSKQFKQLTQSVSEYIKSSTDKISAKK